MSKAETAVKIFESCNCAQAVLGAYAGDLGIDMDKALQTSVGFGGGMGRLQETCGAVSGAVLVLGLASRFKEADGREKINEVYAKTRRFVEEFTKEMGTANCRELLNCDLSSEEGQKFFKDNNLKDKCRSYVRLCCEMLDKYLAEKSAP